MFAGNESRSGAVAGGCDPVAPSRARRHEHHSERDTQRKDKQNDLPLCVVVGVVVWSLPGSLLSVRAQRFRG